MEVVFILARSKRSENIGAAARALKTQGFKQLRLVDPPPYGRCSPAQWLAHGSEDILDQAQAYMTLEEAVADCDLVIATSSKSRHHRGKPLTPEKTLEVIESKHSELNRVGILFGREDTGLLNEELAFADLTSAIPMACETPTLNLAQSVMVYAYVLSKVNSLASDDHVRMTSQSGQYQALKQKFDLLFNQLNFKQSENVYAWSMEQLSKVNSREIGLLHTVLNRIEQKMNQK